MAYTPTDWKDHVVQRPKTFEVKKNADGTLTLVPSPGDVIQQGTPMSATNFNNAEQGILTAHSMLDLLYTFIMLKLSYSDHTLDSLDAAKLDLHGKADSAGKADKLTNPRTITISGGATAASVAFDGSGNITINVTALNPAQLSEAVPVTKGGTGATTKAAARTNLEVPSNLDIAAMLVFMDAMQSVNYAAHRANEQRLTAVEAKLDALSS
jgi:hypothetical protein